MNTMTVNTPPPMGGNAIPKANKTPANDCSIDHLFLRSQSASVPNITSPRAISMMGTYAYMTNLTSIPPYNCPKNTQFQSVFEGCTGITDIQSFTFLPNAIYVQAFAASGVQRISLPDVFKTGSNYQKCFFTCASLVGITDPGPTDNYEILGINHRDCFFGAPQFELPLSYNADVWIQFPESKDIAGCLRDTNAVGRVNTGTYRNGAFRLDALHAKYANNFLNASPATDRPSRYFHNLTCGLQNCEDADALFGYIKVYWSVYMEYTPAPSSSTTANFLRGVEIDPSGNTGLQIYKNLAWRPDINDPDPDDTLSADMIRAITSYGREAWRQIWLDNMKVSLRTINAIQDTVYCGVGGFSKITFSNCTFTNPTGITKLNLPWASMKFYVDMACENQIVLNNALTEKHVFVGTT